ncbi:SH3 domain-containing protein [Clostridium perfringens]|nr:SH3 domain-containing protein [Clostridium perfringens]
MANSLISKIGDYKAQNGLHGWTVYIAPCMNPDGVIVRGTNNGPGRCAVKSRIDMNRCFPRGFTAQYNSRNYTGPNPLGAQEAVALKEFIEKINRTADELVVIDGHGWLGCTYGDSSIAQYFTKQFGFSHNGPSGGGYFSYWAQGLPRTRGLLLEYPDTYSYGEVISRNYIGKTFNAIINILKNNPNGSDVDTNTDSNYDKWVNKDGKWYYYENGKMVIGWKFVDGEWYYLESNGVMATGWKELGGIWYYLNESGAIVKGWQTISGKTYYFNDSGHMLVGKQVIDGRNYNFNTSGQLDSTNWVKSNNKWYYYENGKMITGWKLINGEWYYLESNGVMATGWKELGGIWYYLNESGAIVKGWQTISGKTYYFNDSGHMLVGKQVIDGRNYNFNTSGQLDSTNWVKSNNKWYYYENGKMITGWKLINGEWYYLESNGVMATGWKELGGIWYYLNESGAMVKGWQTISGKTYYFNDSGHMLTGKQVIDGKNYEFNGSGQLISDTGDISSSDMTYIAAGEVINVQSFLNVRKGPGTNYDSIGQLHQGDKVSIVAKNGEWYKIKYGSGYGYIHSNFINIVLDEDINKKILKFAGNTGFFENMNLEFEFFNKRIPLGAISFSPLITVEAEISLNMKLDNGSKINLTLTPDELTAEFLGKFNALGVTSSIDKRHLTSVFEKLTLSRNVIDGFRYQVILGPAGTINVTFESTFEYDFGNGNKESIYQRLYFTIHPHLNPNLPSVVRIADIDIETDETVKIEDKNIMQLIHKGIVQFVSYVHYQFSKITIPDIKPITPQQVSIIGSVALGVIIILACVLV